MPSLLGFQYTQHTPTEVKDHLASRLNDPSYVYWDSTELDFYLQEALETWNFYARYFSYRGTTTLTAGQHEIDLSTITGYNSAGTSSALLSHSVSGQRVLKSILLHLLELQDTNLGTYSPTGHVAQNLLNQYISISFNQFIQESYCYVNKREYPITDLVLSGLDGKYNLDQNISNIVRAEHITLESNVRPLNRVSLEEAHNLTRNFWNSPARPQYYSLDLSAPLKIYLLPWPNDTGTLRLYTIETTDEVDNLLFADTSHTMPYELWCGVKWLALYKIHSTDGPTTYPQMADYALQRYNEYLALARDYTPVNFGWIEEKPIHFSPFNEFDNLYPGWKNRAAIDLDSGGKPQQELGILSPNLLVSPRKYSRTTSFSFDLVRNVPDFTTLDYFPVGEENLGYILDYAEHLACIKMGGAEFEKSLPLYNNFIQGAMRYNDKLTASLAKLRPQTKTAYAQSQSSQESDRRESPETRKPRER